MSFIVSRAPHHRVSSKIRSIMKIYYLLILLLASACATAPRGAIVVSDPNEVPSVQERYRHRLGNIKIGMSLKEFRNTIPEAYVAGQNMKTTAYELKDVQKYVTQQDIDTQNFLWGFGSPRTRTKSRVLWFYFYNDQLVKWGQPQDWPERPDLIIEHRER